MLSDGFTSLRGLSPSMGRSMKTLNLKGLSVYNDSVEGMNFDFVAMNLTGFLFYSIYNTEGYFVNNKQTGQVDLNDVFFAYHALFATLITITQVAFFKRGANKIHSYTILLLIAMWSFVIVWSALTMVS